VPTLVSPNTYGFIFDAEHRVDDGSNVTYYNSPVHDFVSARAVPSAPLTFTAGAVALDAANENHLGFYRYASAQLTSSAAVPNGAQAQNPSGGFSCTGLARLANGNWLVGNDGRATMSDVTFNSSLVIVSSDFSAIVDELDMASVLGSYSIQGVCQDPNDGHYWFASSNGNVIKKVNASTGAEIASFAATGANGLAYDADNDYLLYTTGSSSVLYRIDASTGASVGNIALAGADFDQICLDGDALYITTAPNGVNGDVLVFDYLSGWLVGVISGLPNAQAIEGIVIDGNTMYIANDGGLHTEASPAESLFLTYTFHNKFSGSSRWLGARIWVDVTTAGNANNTLLASGNPSTGNGWALYITNTNVARLYVRTATGLLYRRDYPFSYTGEYEIAFYIDFDGDTQYFSVDGVELTSSDGSNSPATITGDVATSFVTMGAIPGVTGRAIGASVSEVWITDSAADWSALDGGFDVDPTFDLNIRILGIPNGDWTADLYNKTTGAISEATLTFTGGICGYDTGATPGDEYFVIIQGNYPAVSNQGWVGYGVVGDSTLYSSFGGSRGGYRGLIRSLIR
tara:strand:+ start:907 stop:2622 length:1716 start_codon:yes stop_codon:yes gene_type:complete